MNADEYKKVLRGLLNEQFKHDTSLVRLLSGLDRTGEIQRSKAGKYRTDVDSKTIGESAYQRAIISAETATLGSEQVTWLDIELPVVFQPLRRIDLLGRSSRSHLVLCELKHDGTSIDPCSKGKPWFYPNMTDTSIRVDNLPLRGGGKTVNALNDQTPAEKRASMTWAKRLKRVFDIDIETCNECGGDVLIIASIEDPVVIQKILAHLDKKGTFARNSLLPDCRDPPTAGLFV